MKQKVWLHLRVACLVAAVPIVGCSGDSPSPVSPTAVASGPSEANPDGSTLKATAPSPLSPINDVRLDNHTPVFRFANAQGRFADGGFGYQIELLNQGGHVIYSHVVGQGPGETTHTYPGNLESDTPYRWRVRAVLGTAHGPWSTTAGFITVARPRFDPSNVFPFIVAFAQGSPEWAACVSGSGTACFRFVWDVGQALNPNCDPTSWGLLSKNPGEWQCTRGGCGSLGGVGFGEDILTFGGSSPMGIYDIITAAGAPGASLSWQNNSFSRRAGNDWACPWR
jgi:hypothetical protein